MNKNYCPDINPVRKNFSNGVNPAALVIKFEGLK